jgi:hypothetical protein
MFGEMGGHSLIDRSHLTRGARDDNDSFHDVRYHDDNDSFRPATTDPYQAQQPQSPSRTQAHSPGSRRSPVQGQPPDSRHSPTHYNTMNSPGGREILAGSDDSFQQEELSSPESSEKLPRKERQA